MPVFVVSLILPFTVDFHDPPTPRQAPAPPPQQQRNRSEYFPDVEQRISLFPDANAPAAQTPGSINSAHEQFFTQVQPSATIHFVRPHDPRSLVRSDGHAPEWGPGQVFNHPPSRAQELPPSRLLEYSHIQNLTRDTRKKKSPSPRSRKGTMNSKFWGSEWSIEPAEQGNGGLTNAVKAAQRENTVGDDIIWMGTLGFPTDSLDEAVKSDIADKLESDLDAITIFVNDTDFDGHYVHYCKTILWPVFHYQIPDHPKSKAYEDHSWVYYKNLNQAFADKIVASYKRNDTIWIHDYHLLLVPGMVRKKLPDAKIGIFLHVAFPSSEVFRCLSTRNELLEGMLGANVIAFQCEEYQEHFLTTCSRLLVVEAFENGLQLEDRFVNVVSLPIGVDPEGLSDARNDPEVYKAIEMMRERYKGKRLIVARDKIDAVRGVRQKLLAYELFLNKYPEYKENVVLIQVGTTSPENKQLNEVISEIVTRIDSAHSTLAHQPLIFLRQDLPFPQFLALLSIADVLMITNLREGMNLTAHEFILCQDGKQCDKTHGPVILSEFTGASSLFKDGNTHITLPINPWDYKDCAHAIKQALDMSSEERERRYTSMRAIITENTGSKWVRDAISQINRYHAEQQQQENAAIPRLSMAQVSDKYSRARKRLFFLDYDGTLALCNSIRNVHLSSPQRVLDTLNHLMLDNRNVVYVTSDRMAVQLQRIFERATNLGIIAENGCFAREFNKEKWHGFPAISAMKQWKESVKSILKYYQERLAGSTIEERHCSMVFRYDAAEDQDGAARQAGDCANHINDACGSQRVHVVPIDKALLIEPLDYTKATAADWVFQRIVKEDGVAPDFLFVAGDDREDEVLFKWANKLGQDGVVQEVVSVSLGRRNTEAIATLTQGTSGLLSVLQKLARLR